MNAMRPSSRQANRKPLWLGLVLFLASCGADERRAHVWTDVDRVAYGVSHILLAVDPQRGEGDTRRLAWQAYERTMGDESFAALAEGHSDDESRHDGGYLGFVQPSPDTAFGGAIQGLAPGGTSPPIRTPLGWHVIHRHTFDDALALEAKYTVPVQGFNVSFAGPEGAPPERGAVEEALAKAKEAVRLLREGTISLDQARARYAPEDPRRPGEHFLGGVTRRQSRADFFDALRALPSGQWLDPVPLDDFVPVVQRIEPLRAFVRHILVQHAVVDIHTGRTPEQARARAQEVLDKLLADPSAWNRMVENFSDDVNTRGDRGTMALLAPGASPWPFEKAVRETPPGQIYKRLVETERGYHVIWRVR